MFGLLILIQDSGDIRAIINLTEEEALKINSEFDSNEAISMQKLCDELKGFKKDKSLILTKSEKVIK